MLLFIVTIIIHNLEQINTKTVNSDQHASRSINLNIEWKTRSHINYIVNTEEHYRSSGGVEPTLIIFTCNFSVCLCLPEHTTIQLLIIYKK